MTAKYACIASARASGSKVTLDGGFGKDVEEWIGERSQPWNPPSWDLSSVPASSSRWNGIGGGTADVCSEAFGDFEIAISAGAYIGKTGLKLLAYRPFNAAIYVPGTDAQGRPLSTEGNAESRVPFGRGIYGPQGYYLDNPFTSSYHSGQFEVNKRF